MSDNYYFDQSRRNILSAEQRKLLIGFMDMMWEVKKDWLIDENDGDNIYDMKVRFSNSAHIEKLLSHVSPKDSETHNASAVSQLLDLHDGNMGATIALRYTRGPSKGAIGWHFDGGYAIATVQVSLNDDSDYEGGRLCFYSPQRGVNIPQRCAGDITKHDRTVLHAVTKLTAGSRYSLFVVDSANGLGDAGVVESSMEVVEAYLATLQPKNPPRVVSVGNEESNQQQLEWTERAWKYLTNPIKCSDAAALQAYLDELGVTEAFELSCCTALDLSIMADHLKRVPKVAFLSIVALHGIDELEDI